MELSQLPVAKATVGAALQLMHIYHWYPRRPSPVSKGKPQGILPGQEEKASGPKKTNIMSLLFNKHKEKIKT